MFLSVIKSVKSLASLRNSESGAWLGHTAHNDILIGIIAFHVWGSLGLHDIKQRYRRSIIGPFWFTLSTLIMVAVLGVLYSLLLKQEITDYLPYLGVGLVVWQFISSCVIEGANSLISASFLIKQIRMPVTVHAVRVAWRNFIVLLHSLPVVFILLLFFSHSFSYELFFILPGLFLLLANGIWIGIVLGLICTRYRDVNPIVTNLIQVGFFFTPVMWMPELLSERAWIANWNPMYHLIELIRAPMIGRDLSLLSWAWSVGLIIFGFGLAQILMLRARNRVAYWL